MGEPDSEAVRRTGKQRFGALPERIPFAEMVETVDTDRARDPRMGRDTETEFMLRNAG
jgi:hypothetical protein